MISPVDRIAFHQPHFHLSHSSQKAMDSLEMEDGILFGLATKQTVVVSLLSLSKELEPKMTVACGKIKLMLDK